MVDLDVCQLKLDRIDSFCLAKSFKTTYDPTMDLLTTMEAAALLGVSGSSVKRWAEEGRLVCAKTAGKHRRFERSTVERFRFTHGEGGEEAATAGTGRFDQVVSAIDPHILEARLLDERGRSGSWWRVAEGLAPVLVEIGQRWADGSLTVLEEHLASERIARALARVCDRLPVAPRGPLALLATAEGDDHTLGLSLVEVCLRELGWRTLWAGRDMPTDELTSRLAAIDPPVRLLAISASSASANASVLARQARRLGEACQAANAALVLGGAGRWPGSLRYGRRITSLAELHIHALSLLGGSL